MSKRDAYRRVRVAQRKARKLECKMGCTLHNNREHQILKRKRALMVQAAKREVPGALPPGLVTLRRARRFNALDLRAQARAEVVELGLEDILDRPWVGRYGPRELNLVRRRAWRI